MQSSQSDGSTRPMHVGLKIIMISTQAQSVHSVNELSFSGLIRGTAKEKEKKNQRETIRIYSNK